MCSNMNLTTTNLRLHIALYNVSLNNLSNAFIILNKQQQKQQILGLLQNYESISLNFYRTKIRQSYKV